MKHIVFALTFLGFTSTLCHADPAGNAGRVLPHLELLNGTVYKNTKIQKADAKGITIEIPEGTKFVSRYLLPPESRVALGYEEEPKSVPREGYFRVVQVGPSVYIVRYHYPAAPNASDAIFDRVPTARDGDRNYLLKGDPGFPLADRDIFNALYVPADETESMTTVEGATRTLKVIYLLSAKR